MRELKKLFKTERRDAPMRCHYQLARRVIGACEAQLGRRLTDGQRRDLLADNTQWTTEFIRVVVDGYESNPMETRI